MESTSERETRLRALALEGALLLLLNKLALRGTISVDEGEEMLRIISKSSDLSVARTSHHLNMMSQLRALRGGGDHTPGAGSHSETT